jgi:hypothetical protein
MDDSTLAADLQAQLGRLRQTPALDLGTTATETLPRRR